MFLVENEKTFSGIAEPENCAIVLAVAAEGEQIYESKPNPAGGFQWSLERLKLAR